MPRTLRVGTRGSQLALAQTEWVVKALQAKHPDIKLETVVIRTKGDVVVDRPLREMSGKGFFVREIEMKMLEGTVDFAVHSLKDMPTELPKGLTMAALCNRVDPRDALVVRGMTGGGQDWRIVTAQLPPNPRIGTSSLRRQAQLKNAFPHWRFCELRGNVDTRLRKLDKGQYDAIVVAAAGLLRLGLQNRIACLLPVEVCCPEAGQGVLAVEAREDDGEVLALLTELDEFSMRVEVTAERAATREMGAGCHAAVGALARLQGRTLTLWVAAAQPDGSQVWRHQSQTTLPDDPDDWLEEAKTLGINAARELLRQGAVIMR